MALIQTSPLVQGISGSVGGVNFASSSRGSYVRARGLHCDVRSEKQLECRRTLDYVRIKYRALTWTQRKQWQAKAQSIYFTDRLGFRKHPSAYHLFLKFNMLMANWGFTVQMSPPLLLVWPSPIDVVPTFTTAPSYTFTWVLPPGYGAVHCFVYGSRQFRESGSDWFSNWRLVYRGYFVAGGQDITAQWIPVLGELRAGEIVGLRVYTWILIGFPSIPVLSQVTVTV